METLPKLQTPLCHNHLGPTPVRPDTKRSFSVHCQNHFCSGGRLRCSNTAVGFCMTSEELIFVTGATGFLGMQLVHELLEQYPHAMLALLIRDRPSQSGQQRADSIVPQDERSRVQVYSGDVGQPNCGMDATAWSRLSAETTRVIHCAATVRFDHSLDEARRINVEGTRRVLDFAAGMRRLREPGLCRYGLRGWRARGPGA